MPKELHGDPRRQAVPSIRGTVYQAWCSIDAWLQLSNADQVIYLEGAEDFDVVTKDGAVTIQVRHTGASISLGVAKARDALEHFWALTNKESNRQIEYHYLTTSTVGTEQGGDFGGLNGLEAWSAARTNTELAKGIASYLLAHLSEQSVLRPFLTAATPTELQARLFSRFHWLTDQPSIDAVRQSVDERIRVLLHQQKRSGSLVSKVRAQLESHFWQVVVRESSSARRLTLGELLELVEDATTTYLPVPTDQITELLGSAPPGLGLLRLLRDKVPQPPSPLIPRPDFVHRIEVAANQRRSVLLTGTVFKGKTTAAQLVAGALCPDAWWISLTGRQADQVDTLLRALAVEVDSGACPALLIFDDLDISPSVHRVYRDSLAMLLHRMHASGRAVLMSAQGSTIDVAQLAQWDGVEIIEVPELQSKEVEQLCIQEGCPEDDAEFWGATVCVLSAGHPKLAQVRVSELAKQGWQRPSADYLVKPSVAAGSVKQIARRLLSDSVAPDIAAFLYSASESVVLLHRSVAIRLAELVGGIQNPGDVLEYLAGKWLDCIELDWFRATPLLKGTASDVWSPQQLAAAHIRLHDSILSKRPLNPEEGAALLYHAFIAREPQRLATAAMKLRILENDGTREAVERNLLWLPYVALASGERVVQDAMAGAAFRALQFDVAVTLDSYTLPSICARWVEETALVPHVQMQLGMQVVMWSSIAIANSAKVPLENRLGAILGLASLKLDGEIGSAVAERLASFLSTTKSTGDGIPESATQPQILLALCTRWMRSASVLADLLNWLDSSATDEIRSDFDLVLGWPLVQTSGAFVHSAWSAEHEEVSDWTPWLGLLDRITEYAIRRVSPNMGREAAKAKATLLTEYLSRPDEALQALDRAEQDFGVSPVLSEQRINVLFQTNDDAKVLERWHLLVSENQPVLDPFAYRRVAISAARLEKWGQSEELFRDAATLTKTWADGWMQFGFTVDCALVTSLGGNQIRAADTLAQAINSLPATASDEGDGRGEAVQRAASEVCRFIDSALWTPLEAKPKIKPGYASSPDLRVPDSAPGQDQRTALVRGMVAKLSACLGVGSVLTGDPEVESLATSAYPYARYLVAEAQVANTLSNGAGAEFVHCFARFTSATATIQSLGVRAKEKHTWPVADVSGNVEGWTGFLIAGACCAGTALCGHLEQWQEVVKSLPVPPVGLEKLITQLQMGAESTKRDELRNLMGDASNAVGVRCGAAAKLLLQPLQPRELLQVQCWLAAATVADASVMRQELFNLHVANRFARQWALILQSPFLLPTPKTTIPPIQASIADLAGGGGTLRTLLTRISHALGQPLGEILSNVR
ncbi:hypothetical protein [Ralstonia solanacearum]|uniref:hypothetical protein n=1 Tax=Ralstonia solanacearum TaxID=305 RepID=UPI0011C3E0AD|nr:hypothetical protein [Ralstonia solanacearum]